MTLKRVFFIMFLSLFFHPFRSMLVARVCELARACARIASFPVSHVVQLRFYVT